MEIPDPYQTLGVAKDVTSDEIKSAYRTLAKKYHPDLNPGNSQAERKFKGVSAAYERIGTPENRAKHDRGGFDETASTEGPGRGSGPRYHQTQAGGGRYASSFGGSNFDEDLFRSIFGEEAAPRGGRAGPRPGADQVYRMDLELREASLGAERQITLPGGRRLAVRIPPGVVEGTRLRFSGQGDPGVNGGPPGDAYVQFHIRDDSRFRRRGDDLELALSISLAEAVAGGEVAVSTLEGSVLLKVPRRSNTDDRLRLGGKGVFNRSTGKRGDLLVTLKVKLPPEMDPALAEVLTGWQAQHPYDPRAQTKTRKQEAA